MTKSEKIKRKRGRKKLLQTTKATEHQGTRRQQSWVTSVHGKKNYYIENKSNGASSRTLAAEMKHVREWERNKRQRMKWATRGNPEVKRDNKLTRGTRRTSWESNNVGLSVSRPSYNGAASRRASMLPWLQPQIWSLNGDLRGEKTRLAKHTQSITTVTGAAHNYEICVCP